MLRGDHHRIKVGEFFFDFPIKVINWECCWIFGGILLHETWFNGSLIGVGLDKVGTTQSEDIGSICHRHQQWPRAELSGWREEGGGTKPRSGDSHGYSRQQKWDRVSQGSGHFYNIQNRCLEYSINFLFILRNLLGSGKLRILRLFPTKINNIRDQAGTDCRMWRHKNSGQAGSMRVILS